jgi:hypothetical protein
MDAADKAQKAVGTATFVFHETLADIDAFLKRVEAIGVMGLIGAKNGPSVEYERENDNAPANRTVLHQKCSPATAEG